ncbi:MAG: uroporphyrinogen decarboxylase [Alphaproteobacteria bacterium]
MDKKEKPLLEVLKNKRKDILPIWIMRQAGRYLPEYREVRSKVKNFLELCYSPDLATEVTLQPIRRFNFDAAIIFSDILVIPDALGVNVRFVENEGPKLDPITSLADVNKLKTDQIIEKLTPVYEAIKLTKKNLPEEKTLIGFAGSPWTISTYMIQGKISKDFNESKVEAYRNSEYYIKLIDILVESIIIHCSEQIKSGVEVIQLFDSWAGILPEELYCKFVIAPTQKIVNHLKDKYPHIPIIGFPKNSGMFYKKYIDFIKPDGLSVDSSLPLEYLSSLGKEVTLQGNLDPAILFTDKKTIEKQVYKILAATKHNPFIFNLGHGILPKTPIENVEFLLEIIRKYEK